MKTVIDLCISRVLTTFNRGYDDDDDDDDDDDADDDRGITNTQIGELQ